ncbi:EcoRII N-terminal effector-binding domain-containing protein [Brevundimonas diminuta ATCC 11568]
MKEISFSKTLSANDTGLTGGHQAGILVPKGDRDLLAFFPHLDPAVENPDAWIAVTDEHGEDRQLRYIYYNKKLHGTGTRDEYRITHLTKYLRDAGARPGDALVFTGVEGSGVYRIRVEKAASSQTQPGDPGVIRLSGWRRMH